MFDDADSGVLRLVLPPIGTAGACVVVAEVVGVASTIAAVAVATAVAIAIVAYWKV